MPAPESPVIVAALRTPIGTAHHALAQIPVEHLAAPVLSRLAEHARHLTPAPTITDVVMGNTMGPGGNPARVAALTAGLGDDVPALTVDRQCASGLAAIDLGAALLHTRRGAIIAGGAESASTAPWRFWPPSPAGTESPAGTKPQRYERAPFAPPDRDPDMGPANDAFARSRGITRERQDEYAARSHARAVAAQQAGRFDA
ncbi:beta-ketoacyl synthase N-terminal-like domain-containing protein, partial [Kribbia dieselivorans]|uniref:thiolase family protein n=1 Tax=Kribbia dieselivorans TaxID=331526 RepID=UPI000A4C4BDA